MKNWLRRSASVVLFGALACESPLGINWDGQPLLRTEGTEFQLFSPNSTGMFATIPYSFSNQTGRKVLLSNCDGAVSPSLEKKQGRKWVTAWAPIRLLCASAPIEIQPGEIFQDTLHLVAAEFGSKGALWAQNRGQIPATASIFQESGS